MGAEYLPETIWKAQELYCSDRLPFVRIAAQLNIADSTLRRWANTFGWREKREEIAKALADIRANKVLARAKTIEMLLNTPRADLAFAVSSLETLAVKEAELARAREEKEAVKAAEQSSTVTIRGLADAIPILRGVVEGKLSSLLTRPENVNLKDIQEIKKSLELLQEMEKGLPVEQDAANAKGLSAEMYDKLLAVLSGQVEV